MNDFTVVAVILLVTAIPVTLTVFNIIQLYRKCKTITKAIIEFLTFSVGAIFLYLYFCISDVKWVPWYEQIIDYQSYPPYDPERIYQVIIIFGLAFLGWLFLRLCPLEKQPPLAIVISYAFLYLFLAELIILMVQMGTEMLWVVLYPINILLILTKLIREQISYRKNMPVKDQFAGLRKLLSHAGSLPVAGFVFLALFVGLLLLILVLFGQSPDEIIKGWTNTADWTLSMQTPPPKVPYDGHYLCTVAANGHPKLVRPLRTGKRQGHTILVNRQLLIANAFEDLIKERTPKFHRAVRNFYDKTGFPISRHIQTRFRSDIVYLLMKPLEWVFLLVLYLFDAKPENRINVQYIR